MKSNPFTVVVPTRERAETLWATLKSCVGQDYDQLRILVSDNESRDHTRDVIASFADPRIEYINPGRRLSMSTHFNFALSHVGPGIVCSIGDDDALMPGAISLANEIFNINPDLPLACSSIFYSWPNVSDTAAANQILIRTLSNSLEIRQTHREVQRRLQFRLWDQGYVWGLPAIYRGFVPDSVFAKIRNCDPIIRSITPDAYLAFATAAHCESYAYWHRPLFVEGVSKSSNGAAQTQLDDRNAKSQVQTEESRYLAENDLPIHERMVYSPSPLSVMVEAFLQAADQHPSLKKNYSVDLRNLACAIEGSSKGPRREECLQAAAEMLLKNNLDPAIRTQSSAAELWRLIGSSMAALRAVKVDGAVYQIKDVWDAAIVANTLINIKSGTGVTRGPSLFVHKVLNSLGFASKRS